MYTVSQVMEIKGDGTVKMGCLTSACQGCKASMFCNNRDVSEYEALNPDGIALEKGDYAELYMPPGRTIFSTVLVFALPLVLFPIGYLVSRAAFPALNEMVHALFGFAAMALAFAIASAVSVIRKKRLMPEIVRIVGKATVPGESEICGQCRQEEPVSPHQQDKV